MTRPSFLLPSWLVWAVALICIFGGLGSFAILDNNEGLYAEIPREMLASGDWRKWIIPHLNGLPYMEKPPLLYWLTAASFALFGYTEWAARLVPALSSLACVAMLMHFGRRVGQQAAGRLAALMFASGIGVLAMSRVLMFDMLLTALLAAALFNTWLYLREGRPGTIRWAYAALALAVLTKGLVALVLYPLVILCTLLATLDGNFWRAVRSLLDPVGLLIFAALLVPWHVAASMVEPIFAWFYFYNEHVLRFLGQRQPHDYYGGPWWYYLPRMAIYLFPWSFLVLLRLAPAVPGRTPDRKLNRFLLLAWLMPLLFFSTSTAKANYYLVTVMPFAALHLAVMVDQRDWQRSPIRIAPLLVTSAICMLLAVVAMSRELSSSVMVLGMDEATFLVALFASTALIAALLAGLGWHRPVWSVAANSVVSLWVAAALGLMLTPLEPNKSSRSLAAYLQQQQAGREVFLYRDFERKSSLAFYLKQPVRVIESVSADLHWGNRLRANDITLSYQQFGALAAHRRVAVIVTDDYNGMFKASAAARGMESAKTIGNTTVYVN